jgi:hypothetical protein
LHQADSTLFVDEPCFFSFVPDSGTLQAGAQECAEQNARLGQSTFQKIRVSGDIGNPVRLAIEKMGAKMAVMEAVMAT